MTTLSSMASRRNSAPVKGPMKGTSVCAATGCAAADVGVPTGPSSANTRSFSISSRVVAAERPGS